MLDSFLAQTNLKPNEIIFIDDRLSNVIDLENYCKHANINFIGIHDDRILKKYSSFDENLGRYQFQHLEHKHIWLSDEEGRQKMAITIPFENIEESSN